MKTKMFFANFLMVLAMVLTSCSGQDSIIDALGFSSDDKPVVNQTMSNRLQITERNASNIGKFTITNKGDYEPTGSTAQTMSWNGSDGQTTTSTLSFPLGYTVNAETSILTPQADKLHEKVWMITQKTNTKADWSDGAGNTGTDNLTATALHFQVDPSVRVDTCLQVIVEKEIEYITVHDTLTVEVTKIDSIPYPVIEILRDTIYQIKEVEVAPRQYVHQSASVYREILEMKNPGSYAISDDKMGKYIKGENMQTLSWVGSDNQASTVVLTYEDDTEVSAETKVTYSVKKLHTQVYLVEQTITTQAEYSTKDGKTGVENLVTVIRHYQVDPTVPTEVVTEYVEVHDTVTVTKVEYVQVPVEVPVEVPVYIEVHDTTVVTNTVYVEVPVYIEVHDTVYVEKEVIVEVTKTVDNYIYVYVPSKELYIIVDNGTATVMLDDENALEAELTLKEKKTTVEKGNLGKVELINESALTSKKSFVFTDNEAYLLFSAKGCTVKSAQFDHKDVKILREGELYLIKLFFKVTFTYEDRNVVDNEVKTEIKERSFLISKAYVQQAEEEIVPEIEEPEYVPTLDFNLQTTATDHSLSVTFHVENSDNSFNKTLTVKAGVCGLFAGIDTLYVGSTTPVELTEQNYVGKLIEADQTKKDSKDGVWHQERNNIQTKDEVKFLTSTGGKVGPLNKVNYYYMTITCHLPNGEDIVWTFKPETVVDTQTYTNDGFGSFYTPNENRLATYYKSLHQGVHHYITATVTYNGETKDVEIPCLTKASNGKYILGENSCVTNIFVTE